MSKMCGVTYYLRENVKNVWGYTNICAGLHKNIKAGDAKKIRGIFKNSGEM